MIPALVIAAAIQAAAPAVTSVEQVERELSRIEGQTVRVRGWLNASCGGLTCAIQDAPSRPGEELSKHSLSLASESPVEAQLVGLKGRHVILTARAGRTCDTPDGKISCISTDRASELIPIAVTED